MNLSYKMRSLAAVVILISFVSRAAEQGNALYVDGAGKAAGDGSAAKPFTTIKAAIDAAKSGDTIKVAKGTYEEKLVVEKKNLVLLGSFKGGGDFGKSDTNASLTVIQGATNAPVLLVSSAEGGHISGFKITGGFKGIELAGCKGIAITGNIVQENFPGGGIRLNDVKSISILNNAIVNNKVDDDGAGIGSRRGRAVSDIVISGNYIAGNVTSGEHGGGIYISGNGVISSNLIERNEAYHGAGMFVDTAVFTISHNIVRNNKTEGIFVIDYSKKGNELVYALDHNLIYGHPKEGIKTYWASLTVVNCTIADNGGGPFAKGRDDPNLKAVFKNCIFSKPCLNAKGSTVSYSLSDNDILGEGNIKGDPLFVSTDKDNPDYHLKSAAGRWDSKAKDDATSPAIDAGDPASDFSKEPSPNGGRIDLGVYGNTPEASKSVK